MVKPGVNIRFKVKGFFETFEVELCNTATIKDCKEVVRSLRQIPITSQRYFFRGSEATNEKQLCDIGVDTNETIIMCVLPDFVERVHPWDMLDPFTGKLPLQPTNCSDKCTYDKTALEEWGAHLSSLNMRLQSPMTCQLMQVRELNTDLQDNVSSYLKGIDEENTQPDFLSIDVLGRVFTILGHCRHVIPSLPRNKRPRLVCLGNESIGKSSDLDRHVMLPIFPSGEARTTRIIVEIRMRRGPQTNPVFRVIQGRGMENASEEEEDVRENGRACLLREVIPLEKGADKMQLQMGEIMGRITREFAGEGLAPEVCVDRYIVLDLVGPSYPDLTIVDIPGLAANDRDLIQEMMINDFNKFGDYSIYLHMTKASENTDDGAYQILDSYEGGRLLKQTIGIVTQMDTASIIPEKPDREAELLDLALGVCRNEADHLFPSGTILVMNKDEPTDGPCGYQPVYDRAVRAKEFFAAKGWSASNSPYYDVVGGDALIRRLHEMYFKQLLSTYIPDVNIELQARVSELMSANRELGLPPIVYPLPQEELQPLLNQVITGIITTLNGRLASISMRFDTDHIAPLEDEITRILSSTQDMNRMEADTYIQAVHQSLLDCYTARKQSHIAFWSEELRDALVDDDSDVKLGRFTFVIDVLQRCVEAKIREHFQHLDGILDQFLLREILEHHSVMMTSQRNATTTVPMVTMSFVTDPGMLAHKICGSLRVFSNVITDAAFIRQSLQNCSLVEGCRAQRFEIRNELCLLRTATSELLQLAHGFDSTACLLSPGRYVSFYHIKSGTFLEMSGEDGNYSARPVVCAEYDPMDEAEILHNRSNARFKVVDAGNGDIALYCPTTRRFLRVQNGRMEGLGGEQDGETLPDNWPSEIFYANFLGPPERFNSPTYASRIVSIHNVHHDVFVKVIGEAINLTVDVTTTELSGDLTDFHFLVVSNPESQE